MNYHLPEEVKNILDKFKKARFQIFIVGGAVRDIVMNKPVSDWDFTTDAKPEEILKLFPDGFYDNKFGTVGLPVNSTSEVGFDSSEVFEVTTMRKEGIYKDNRHPTDISWTNKIEEDLSRRDFTINAIALNFTSVILNGAKRSEESRTNVRKQAFEAVSPQAESVARSFVLQCRTQDDPDLIGDDNLVLVDPFHGQDDIKNKLIKAVGDPNKRFQEDALRLMRAVRIAAQLEFEIDDETFQAIKENTLLLQKIAWERIRDELFKILASGDPYAGLVKLRQAGILQIILPEIEKCFGIIQQGPKHDRVYDIGEHSLLALKFTPSEDPLVRFAGLLHDIGKPDTVQIDSDGNVTFFNHDFIGGKIVLKIAQRFNLSKKQIDKLYRLVRWHMFSVSENQTDSAIRRFIKNVGIDNIDSMMAVRVGDRLGGGTQTETSWRIERFKERIKEVLIKPFSISDLKVNGNDVMQELDIKPGPKVGDILQKLFAEVLEDSLKNNRDYLIKEIVKLG